MLWLERPESHTSATARPFRFGPASPARCPRPRPILLGLDAKLPAGFRPFARDLPSRRGYPLNPGLVRRIAVRAAEIPRQFESPSIASLQLDFKGIRKIQSFQVREIADFRNIAKRHDPAPAIREENFHTLGHSSRFRHHSVSVLESNCERCQALPLMEAIPYLPNRVWEGSRSSPVSAGSTLPWEAQGLAALVILPSGWNPRVLHFAKVPGSHLPSRKL